MAESPNLRGYWGHRKTSSRIMKNDSPHSSLPGLHYTPEAKFLDVIVTKVLRDVFPPCYSESPLKKDFTPPPPSSKSGLKLVCNVNITYSLRTLKIMLRNLNEIVRSWIRLQATAYLFVSSGSCFAVPCDLLLREYWVSWHCIWHKRSKKKHLVSNSWNYLQYTTSLTNPPSVKKNDNCQIHLLPLSLRFLSLANGRFSSETFGRHEKRGTLYLSFFHGLVKL